MGGVVIVLMKGRPGPGCLMKGRPGCLMKQGLGFLVMALR